MSSHLAVTAEIRLENRTLATIESPEIRTPMVKIETGIKIDAESLWDYDCDEIHRRLVVVVDAFVQHLKERLAMKSAVNTPLVAPLTAASGRRAPGRPKTKRRRKAKR